MSTRSGAPRFGLSLDPVADTPALLVQAVRAAETAGFDLIGIQDHPYRPDFLDTWTLMTYLAAKTDRIWFTPCRRCPSWRSRVCPRPTHMRCWTRCCPASSIAGSRTKSSPSRAATRSRC